MLWLALLDFPLRSFHSGGNFQFTFEEMYHLSTLVTASFKGNRLEKSWCAVPLPVRFHVYFSGALLLPVPRVGVWAVAGFDL